MKSERKVVVVTGASRGIGAGLVEAFASRNYRIVATSRSVQPSPRPELVTIAGDIGDPTTGPRVIEEALKRFGRIDTLINNAGIFVANRFTRYTAEDYARVVATNIGGFFFITQAAIEAMERQGHGHIVNITTTLVDPANSQVPSSWRRSQKGGLTPRRGAWRSNMPRAAFA